MKKNFFKGLEELEANVKYSIEILKFEDALIDIKEFVNVFLNNEYPLGIILSSEILDSLCTQIGKAIFNAQNVSTNEPPDIISSDLNVYIATMLYKWGGHSVCLQDFIRLQPEKKHIILLTGMNSEAIENHVREHYESMNAKIISSPSKRATETVIWLQQTLDDLKPEKIFLFNHHLDSAAVALMQPKYLSRLIFYHHADYNLCLGVHLNCAQHIDPHPMIHFSCREKLGIKNNIYLPICTFDNGHKVNFASLDKPKPINTCSSGTQNKFEGIYLYNYFDLLPEILKNSSGLHYHIGSLSEQSLNQIFNNLANAGINQNKFKYIPWVASLSKALIENDIDLYLNSFPMGGGKACIEAMSAGIPIATHSNYTSQTLNCSWLCYPEAFCWNTPKELLDYIKLLNPELLKEQSLYSRSHYEKYHHPELIKFQLNKPLSEMIGLIPLALPQHTPDLLQTNLDYIEYSQKLNQKVRLIEAVKVENDQIKQTYKQLEENYKNLETQLNTLLTSKSWRITKSIRYLSSLLKKAFQFFESHSA